MSLEDFITKPKGLIDESGYHQDFNEEMLRDTLVFGLNSDKVRKDAIALGNKLTFQHIYDLAETEESTTAQIKEITQGNREIKVKETHSVRRGQYGKYGSFSKTTGYSQNIQRSHRNPNKSKIKQKTDRENSSSNTVLVDVLDVEAITKGTMPSSQRNIQILQEKKRTFP